MVGHKILITGLVVVAVCVGSFGIFGAWGVQAATPLTTPLHFSPKSGVVGTVVTVKGTDLAHATSVTFDGTIATILSDTSRKITVEVPVGATTGRIKVKTPRVRPEARPTSPLSRRSAGQRPSSETAAGVIAPCSAPVASTAGALVKTASSEMASSIPTAAPRLSR